ncbi:unnamed protein product [Lampetra fluviatilis]
MAPILRFLAPVSSVKGNQKSGYASGGASSITLPCRASPPLCTFQSVAWFKVKSELEIQEMLYFVTDATNFTDPMYKGKVRLAKPGTDDVSLILTDVALNDSREYRCLRKWRCGGREKFRCDSVTLVVNERNRQASNQEASPPENEYTALGPREGICDVLEPSQL